MTYGVLGSLKPDMIQIFYHILINLINESILVMIILFMKFLGMFLLWCKHAHRDEYSKREHFSFKWLSHILSTTFFCYLSVFNSSNRATPYLSGENSAEKNFNLISCFNKSVQCFSTWNFLIGCGNTQFFSDVVLPFSGECYTDWDKITLRGKLYFILDLDENQENILTVEIDLGNSSPWQFFILFYHYDSHILTLKDQITVSFITWYFNSSF